MLCPLQLAGGMRHLYQKFQWIYQNLKFNYHFPFTVLITYTVIGGLIFYYLESDEDEAARAVFRHQFFAAINQTAERIVELRCDDIVFRVNGTEQYYLWLPQKKSLQLRHARDALDWFLRELNLTEIIEERQRPTPWTFLGSLFYSGQLYTTIGYGFPTAKTRGGQVFTIFYILVGIPIFLVFLKTVGAFLSRLLRRFYKRISNPKTKALKRLSRPVTGLLGDVDIEAQKLEPRQQNALNSRLEASGAFPIPWALLTLLLWILFSAALFCIWENDWGYFNSIYFYFVSISTVGLGDIVPSKPDMMILNFVLILVGLVLLSMIFNLIQTTIERFLDSLLQDYLVEIEKMAEIVTSDDAPQEEAIPFEFKMTGGLLSMPLKKVQPDGFLSETKGWLADQIASHLIESRLKVATGCAAESSDEEEQPPEPDTVSKGSQPSVTALRKPMAARYRFQTSRPAFKAVQTMDKIRPNTKDFKAMVFSKLVNSNRFAKIVEDTAPEPPTTITIGTQTEPFCFKNGFSARRQDSTTSSLSRTVSQCDGESLYSQCYLDTRFASATALPESPQSLMPSRKNSSQSILRAVHETPPLLRRYMSPPLPRPQKSNLALQFLKPFGSPPMPRRSVTKRSSCSQINVPQTLVEMLTPTPDTVSGGDYERLREQCGLLPADFKDTSPMRDSGIGKSFHEDNDRIEIERLVEDILFAVDMQEE